MRAPALLLAACLAASCGTTRPPAPVAHPAGWDKVQTGLALLREGRAERAERAFQNAVLDARAADDREGIGFACYHLGAARLLLDRPDAAEPALLDAVAHLPAADPLLPDTALLLADAALRREDAVKAREWLTKADEARTGTAAPRRDLLEARLAALGDDAEAFQKLAATLPEDNPDALALKALSSSRAGRHEEALDRYRKAVEQARMAGRLRLLPGLLGGAAEAEAALGRAEEAVELATRAASAAYGQQRIPEAFHWLDLGADFAEKCPSSPAAEKLKRLFGELSRTVNEAAGGAVETQSNPEEKQP